MTEKRSSDSSLQCSRCGWELDIVRMKGQHYVNMPILACGQCGSLWFDKGKLYTLSHADHTDQLKEYIDLKTGAEPRMPDYPCPRCRISLQPIRDHLRPENIEIYRCPSCGGHLISASDLCRFVEYRAAR